DQSPVAHLPRHDREHFSTIVNTAPRTAPKCSRSRGTPFTLPWNPCSPSRGNPVHDRVEYARSSRIGISSDYAQSELPTEAQASILTDHSSCRQVSWPRRPDSSRSRSRFILVQAALESQRQPVSALSWREHRGQQSRISSEPEAK